MVISQRRKKAVVKNISNFSPSRIIIWGGPGIKESLLPIAMKFNISFVFADSIVDLKNKINSKTLAIVLDEKVIALKDLDKAVTISDLPIYLLSKGFKRPSYYVRFYEKGVSAVIDWPREKSTLADFLLELTKPKKGISGNTTGDKKLANSVMSHLKVALGHKNIKVSVFDGFVFLSGKLNTMFQKEMIISDTSQVLGVKKIIHKNLIIKKSRETDKELERKIKLYAGSFLGKYKRSIAFKVKNNTLTLIGDVKSLEDLSKLLVFIKKQKGILKIYNKTKLRPSLAKKRVERAKLLEEKAKSIFDGVKFISVSIYENSAEVSGTVDFNSDKILVERYLLQMLPVLKVVNKLYVSK